MQVGYSDDKHSFTSLYKALYRLQQTNKNRWDAISWRAIRPKHFFTQQKKKKSLSKTVVYWAPLPNAWCDCLNSISKQARLTPHPPKKNCPTVSEVEDVNQAGWIRGSVPKSYLSKTMEQSTVSESWANVEAVEKLGWPKKKTKYRQTNANTRAVNQLEKETHSHAFTRPTWPSTT